MNRDPLKVSQETSRIHSKDMCGSRPRKPMEVGNSGHFHLSPLLSLSGCLSLRLCLSISTFISSVHFSLLLYALLFKSPISPPTSFPPSSFSPLPHKQPVQPWFCSVSDSTPPSAHHLQPLTIAFNHLFLSFLNPEGRMWPSDFAMCHSPSTLALFAIDLPVG